MFTFRALRLLPVMAIATTTPELHPGSLIGFFRLIAAKDGSKQQTQIHTSKHLLRYVTVAISMFSSSLLTLMDV